MGEVADFIHQISDEAVDYLKVMVLSHQELHVERYQRGNGLDCFLMILEELWKNDGHYATVKG